MDVLMKILRDKILESVMEHYKHIFDGIYIDFDRQIIYWNPNELKANIFESLANIKQLLDIELFIGNIARIDKHWAVVFIYKNQYNDTENTLEIIPNNLPKETKEMVLSIHEIILSDHLDLSHTETDGFWIYIYKPHRCYTIKSQDYLVMAFVNGKIIVYNKELLRELLKVISSRIMY